MELDETVTRVKDLIAKREAIDAELTAIFGGQVAQRRTVTCSRCNEQGHTARSCTKPET